MNASQTLTITGAVRTTVGKTVKHLRKQGRVPGALYRHGDPTLHLSFDAASLERVCRSAGTSRMVTLNVEGDKPRQVLVHRVERDPIKGRILHAVLLELRMTEKVAIEVPVRMVGEAPAEKLLGVPIVTRLEKVRVEALPDHLPTHVDADISSLSAYQDAVRVRDLVVAPEVTILNDPDEVVATPLTPVKPKEAEAGEEAAETQGAADTEE